jgi:alpha-beta hydrolase superfamily lysophospholipase
MPLRSTLRGLRRALLSLLVALLLVGGGLYFHHLLTSPPVDPWHNARLDAEFKASDFAEGRVTKLAQYREVESRVLDQVRDRISTKLDEGDYLRFNRFSPGSLSDPDAWDVNWNRTFELPAQGEKRGVVLLLHGLTDSPYSLRSVGLALAARGLHVLGLRLPGHGTAPAGLLGYENEDLQAAVRLAVQDLRATQGDVPIWIVGYSNGAALAVDYTLDALDDARLARPAGLVLVSPALGITRLAAIGRIRTGLSELQRFGRAAWQVVEVELDPYKYQSFTFHAAGETQRLTSGLARRVARRSQDGPIAGFPPVLAIVSTVDSTVMAPAVVDSLLARLAPGDHELVLFDVNRLAVVQPLLRSDPAPFTRRLLATEQRPYGLTLVTNANAGTLQVMERRVPAGDTRAVERLLPYEWPRTVFSLSHVALPFPPDDPLYGYAAAPSERHVQLGRIEVRGENGVLNVPAWMLTRQRSNPFHGYMMERIGAFMGLPAGSVAPAPETPAPGAVAPVVPAGAGAGPAR